MLEHYIIEELLNQERQKDVYRPQPRLERPRPYGHPLERPYEESERHREIDEDGRENGVIIIDM